MSREWKPGDVVTATVNGRSNARLIAGWSRYDPQLRWAELSPRWANGDDDGCWYMPSQVTDHRPLVVIDPEDRDQVERLTQLMFEVAHPFEGRIADTAAALREFANPTPPKPAEPTGLGAVAVDANGELWIRNFADDDCDWRGGGTWLSWADVAAVEVLSAGVTP